MNYLHPLVIKLADDKCSIDERIATLERVSKVIEAYERFSRRVDDASEYGNKELMKTTIDLELEKLTKTLKK